MTPTDYTSVFPQDLLYHTNVKATTYMTFGINDKLTILGISQNHPLTGLQFTTPLTTVLATHFKFGFEILWIEVNHPSFFFPHFLILYD
jgi:hypothetical protein